MSASFSDSLAAEINSVSRTEVGLKKQERSRETFYLNLNVILWSLLSPLTSLSLFLVDGGYPQTGGDQLQTPGLH